MRHHRWGWAVFALVVASFAGVLQAQEMPGAKEKWRHYQAPHFDLYSTAGDSASREVLYQMEMVRHIFLTELKLVEREKTPVTLFYFGKEKTFRAYLPDYMQKGDFIGMHSTSYDCARILISPDVDIDGLQSVVFHEYVHHLLRASRHRLPPWLEEGIAELYGALQLTKDSVEFGRPSEGRVYELGRSDLIPLEALFAADQRSPLYNNKKHNGVFYAQSWALVHYWLYGKNQLPKGSGGKFIDWVASNPDATPPETKAAFEAIFATDYGRMLREIDAYRQRGTYGWAERPLPDLPKPKTYAKREVASDEVNRRLAVLGVNTIQSALGNYILVQETAKGTTDPEVYESLGSYAYSERDAQTARERWEKAVELGSRNPAVLRNLTRVQLSTWMENFDPSNEIAPALREQLLARVRANIAQFPDETWAYESLVWLQAFSRKPDWQELTQHVSPNFKFLREQDQAMLGIAVAAWKLGDRKGATGLARKVSQFDPSAWTQHCTEVLLARIENRRPDFSQVRKARREALPMITLP